jgi:transcriptional regulator with XRE-family HTH domain
VRKNATKRAKQPAGLDPSRQQFAENLRRHRERVGLSQEGLAAVCNLHRTEISLLERSQRSPRLETVVVLARGLELASAADLLDGVR